MVSVALKGKKGCLFGLYPKCHVWEMAGKTIQKAGIEWGSEKYVKVYCAMCIKAIYAKAHLEKAENIKVVNTL